MIDTWLEAFDNDDVTAVVMVDLSAAFDVVDHTWTTTLCHFHQRSPRSSP